VSADDRGDFLVGGAALLVMIVGDDVGLYGVLLADSRQPCRIKVFFPVEKAQDVRRCAAGRAKAFFLASHNNNRVAVALVELCGLPAPVK